MESVEIKKLRLRLGLTQIEFADRIGTSNQIISRWETGKVKPKRLGSAALKRLEATLEAGVKLPEDVENEAIDAEMRDRIARGEITL